jgi:hypothetical protein
MNSSAPDLTRSEAFVEDLGLHSPRAGGADEDERRLERTIARWARYVPLAVALMGLAFAILPPAGA